MKKNILIILLVVLISLAVVTPALAEGGPYQPGNACPLVAWGWMKGYWVQIDKYGSGHQKGRFYGPIVASRNICQP